MEAPKRAYETSIAEYLEIEDLVWETEVRPKADSGSRFDGQAKGAFLRMYRKWAGGKPALIDVTRIRVAALIGAADAASGKRVLETLAEVGLIKFRGDPVKGRYTIELMDPRDVLIGRRQASHGQGDLFDDLDVEPDATEPTSAPASLRIGGREPTPSGDTAPRLPIPPLSVSSEPAVAPALPQPRNAELPENSRNVPAGAPVAEAPALPQPRISRGGVLPREHDLQDLHLDLVLDPSEDLSLVRRGPPKIFPFGKDLKQVQDLRAGAPATATGGQPAAIGSLLAGVLAGLSTGTSRLERAAELVSLLPSLWPDFAEATLAESDGERDAEHGGEASPLTERELARIVCDTQRALREGRVRKTVGVYFSGAVNKFLKEHGRRPIHIAPRKPR